MRNTVVYRTARALRSAGLATLRFNFRGVEGSEGAHDGNGAEEMDMSACLDWLEAEYPDVPLWAAGFSFGSRTALALSLKQERIQRLICVALPVRAYSLPHLSEVKQPTLILMAGSDEFGTRSDLTELFPDLGNHVEIHQIEGADHLFRGKSPLMEACVEKYATTAMELL
ncbi:MAG: alpha/beta superfamily hydrolase [Planctomycetota bacterium]|jgi:alpha/beta superfamily hydrolase